MAGLHIVWCRVLLCLALLAWAPPLPGRAQAPHILPLDTLLAQLARPKLPDTVRVLHLLHMSGYLIAKDLPRAQTYARQATALAQRVGYGRGQAMALANLAGIYYYAGSYPLAQHSFEQALLVARRVGLPEQIGHAYVGLGNVAQDIGDVSKALSYFEQARQAYARCLPADRVAGQMLVLLNSANAYADLQQPARAIRSLRRALAVARAAGSAPPRLLTSVLTNLGKMQLDAGRPDSARVLLDKALQVGLATHNTQKEADTRAVLAELALAQHQPLLARQQALLALQANTALGDPITRASALRCLAAALHALRRPEAYDTLQRYLTVHDTLLAQERTKVVVQAQAQFHDREQQAQIRTLQQDRRLAAQAQELSRLRTRQERAGLAATVVVLLAGGGALFARYRRRQAAARAAAAQALRQRLAADLHDDVGNLLTQLSMQSSLLREVPGSPEQLLTRLDQLTTTARQATQQMSDVVWGLNQTSQTLPLMLERMRDHAHEVLYPLGIEIDFAASPATAAVPLAPEALPSLYLIYKEALHNVVKHAQATRVTIRLDHAAAGLRLTVADNGRGHSGAARPGGNGLRNMQARARAVGGTVHYQEAAPGLAVVVELPAVVPA